jgi:hypothetical protein
VRDPHAAQVVVAGVQAEHGRERVGAAP